ncbi:MAG: translation initiation factor IF-3, translation initiation factor IF-3 [Candidatus Peregrinibacteria bacterium GW2011_GWF2_38_29]|nr:MAG: translation initiation factor IF-3, translation initiation factor IF-3 [Candidatus Peregrinibacteria bacterium GW2011_GWF2_38_29]
MRINNQIRAYSVRLIDQDGGPVGIVPIEKALQMAKETGYDLCEVAPHENPPICKLLDYGKYLYHQQKLETKQRKMHKQSEVKGIRLGFQIGQHDLETKANQTKKFLEDRCTVKVVMMFRGREITHIDLGKKKLEDFYALVKDFGKLEEMPKRQGNQLIAILTPLGK